MITNFIAFLNALKYNMGANNLNSFAQTQFLCLSSLPKVSKILEGVGFWVIIHQSMDFLCAEGYMKGFPDLKGNTRSQIKFFSKGEWRYWILFAAFNSREGIIEAELSLSAFNSEYQFFLNTSICLPISVENLTSHFVELKQLKVSLWYTLPHTCCYFIHAWIALY